jgi:hypothetical protein
MWDVGCETRTGKDSDLPSHINRKMPYLVLKSEILDLKFNLTTGFSDFRRSRYGEQNSFDTKYFLWPLCDDH